ncbi:hypothetical protein [Streptomyces sp. NPDC005209]|uniref:hypothetical protein n=1 Tax=Streptomyces sp. NPDC005209 TaxID=3156715 RepID=UPI0033BC8801
MSARPTPRGPARPLAAVVLLLLAAFTLAACRNGEGVRDEGPSSSVSRHAPATTGTHTQNLVVPSLTHAEPPSGNS